MTIDKNEISNLTTYYGGEWGINHTRRLLSLITLIGENQIYDQDALWVAAHLHDWGAYPKWAQVNVDHAARSAQVAETYLRENGYPEESITLIVTCIQQHHCGGSNRSIESILLSDADALDFLGVVGILRDYSKNPKDLRKAYEITINRKKKLPGLLVLEKSKGIAAVRIKEMNQVISWFEKDSFGLF
jgi:uncharacterized protein